MRIVGEMLVMSHSIFLGSKPRKDVLPWERRMTRSAPTAMARAPARTARAVGVGLATRPTPWPVAGVAPEAMASASPATAPGRSSRPSHTQHHPVPAQTAGTGFSLFYGIIIKAGLTGGQRCPRKSETFSCVSTRCPTEGIGRAAIALKLFTGAILSFGFSQAPTNSCATQPALQIPTSPDVP